MPPTLIRAFIAIEISPEIKRAASGIQTDLKSKYKISASWARPEGMHLTLKFLGDTPSNQIEPLTQALSKNIKGVNPFEMTLSKPGAFGGRNPKVLWLGMEAPMDLFVLQKKIDTVVSQFGFSKENRPFHPHLTLARIKDPSGTAEMLNYMKTLKPEALKFSVDHIVFFRSDLKPQGAEYTELAVVKF